MRGPNGCRTGSKGARACRKRPKPTFESSRGTLQMNGGQSISLPSTPLLVTLCPVQELRKVGHLSAPRLPPAQQEFAWGVQLIGSGSEAAARAAYQEMQKKYALLLAAHPPLVLRTSLGKASSWYRVRVGTATRASAEALCAKLRASGGSCLVQRN